MFLAAKYAFNRTVCGLLITRRLKIKHLSTFNVYSILLYEMHK